MLTLKEDMKLYSSSPSGEAVGGVISHLAISFDYYLGAPIDEKAWLSNVRRAKSGSIKRGFATAELARRGAAKAWKKLHGIEGAK